MVLCPQIAHTLPPLRNRKECNFLKVVEKGKRRIVKEGEYIRVREREGSG